MDYDDNRLPARLRGQIRATEMVLRYVKDMTKAKDPALRLGFAALLLEHETKLEALRDEARSVNTDKPEAAAAVHAGGDQ